ncbi:MAG: type 1 glutamine amidotransferase [Acidobacteriota bacterium]
MNEKEKTQFPAGSKAARVLVIQNSPVEDIGLYGRFLEEEGATLAVLHPNRGEEFPAETDFDAVIIGGTPLSATQYALHRFLRAEADFLERAMAREIPCLGICFGGQFLSLLLSGQVSPNPTMEIGSYEISLTEEGKSDPLFQGFPEAFPVFHWHGDTFSIPPLAARLAAGKDCANQAFRLGPYIGLQFHLEVTPEQAAAWADVYAYEPRLVGKTKERIICECRRGRKEMERLGRQLIRNFLGICGVTSCASPGTERRLGLP